MNADDQQRRPTRAESLNDIRKWGAAPADQEVANPHMEKKTPTSATVPLRPTVRPRMALVCVCDDGQSDGEWFRLRCERTVIGRTEGDIRIESDTQMSTNHFEIVRRAVKGNWRWYVTDLGSTNGTFVRVESIALIKAQEFMVGWRRLMFVPPTVEADSSSSSIASTQSWHSITPEQRAGQVPYIQEIANDGKTVRHYLTQSEFWIGSDREHSNLFVDDPFVSPRHARVFLKPDGRWKIENAKSHNGLWVKINEVPVDVRAEVLAGEQIFIVKVLP